MRLGQKTSKIIRFSILPSEDGPPPSVMRRYPEPPPRRFANRRQIRPAHVVPLPNLLSLAVLMKPTLPWKPLSTAAPLF